MTGSPGCEEPSLYLGGFGPCGAFLDRFLACIPIVHVIVRLAAMKAKEPFDPAGVGIFRPWRVVLRLTRFADLPYELHGGRMRR